MSWRIITIDNVRFTPAETALMSNIQGATAFGPEILQTVVGEFVEAIQQGGNQFANDGTIPDAVRAQVINRTRWMWLNEFPALKSMQTPTREKLNAEAEKFRDAIAGGHPKIAPPLNPVNTSANLVTMPSAGRPKLRRFRWEREDGI
jgi:hypothetical protein